MSDIDRIEDLEAVVRALAARVAELEAVVESRASARAGREAESDFCEVPRAPARAPLLEADTSFADVLRLRRQMARDTYASAAGTVNLEGLIGRYGTLALATLTVLAAVGSFLAWAIARGLFGPWMRIAFGALFAAALAFIGRRMRIRGERRFGNILLALALATAHVVAWGMGPGLRLVPLSVALSVAAVASAALCVFAIREADDDLLAVGFGGAFAAPFVTGDGSRDPDFWLAAYGIIVFGAGVLATRGRISRMTFRVVSSGAALFAAALLYAPDVSGSPSLLSPSFALAASLAVIVIRERVSWRPYLRTTLVILAAASFLIAIRFSVFSPSSSVAEVLGLVLGGLAIWASTFAFPPEGIAADSARRSVRAYALLDFTLVPLFLLAAAIEALPAGSDGRSAALCALWGGTSAWLAHRSRDGGAFAFLSAGACVELASVPLALWHDRPDLCIPALAVVAAAFGYAATRYPRRVPLAAAFSVAGAAFLWSIARLSDVPAYTSFPFASLRSLAAGAVVAAAFLIVRWHRDHVSVLEGAAPWVAAFLWIDVELGRAFSADVSSFLLVAYFAATGVAVLSAGTKRGRPRLRQIGLGLAVIAGLKALFEAGATQSILAKLGIYLVAGAYLLVVAYMYRQSPPVSPAA